MKRAQLFKIVAAAENTDQTQFARKHGVKPPFISMVLNGHRKSERIEFAIDQFIKRGMQKLNIVNQD